MNRLVILALVEMAFAECSQGVGRVPRTVRVGDIVYSARVRVVPDSSAAPGDERPTIRLAGGDVVLLPPHRINEIVHGKRAVSADTALRLARYLGTSDRFWLNLRARFDLEKERDQLGMAFAGKSAF